MIGTADEDIDYLLLDNGERLAFHYSAGKAPTVVFLSGYASDMSGSKALHLESVLTGLGYGFLRLDYSGHGRSDGAFVDGGIGKWSEDAIAVIRHATRGPLVLVGSSMGGWIMLLVARALAARTAGLVGIAAAPDFTEELMWSRLDAEQRERLVATGKLYLESEYVDDPHPVTLKLIEDGRSLLQLTDQIPLSCPVRLIHGTSDPDVPWQTSLKLAQQLAASDVQITLLKDAGHRLSEPKQLTLIARIIEQLVTELSATNTIA